MTSTLNHDTGEIPGATHRPMPLTFDLRRPDASGEFPFYQPQTIGDVDELARLALGATLVLPINAEPPPPRHAVPTVYMPALAAAETQPVIDLAAVTSVLDLPYPPCPPGYLGAHRHPDDVQRLAAGGARWPRDVVMHGAGMVHAAVWLLLGVVVLAAIR